MKALRSVKTFVAFVLTLTTIALLPVNTVGAAGNDGNYVSEVYIAYGKDEEAAEKVLRDKGFTPIKKRYDNQVNNINTKGETAAVLGYKTTNDIRDSITDLAVMNMRGDYNVEDYNTLLKSQKTEIAEFLGEFMAVIREYRANLKAGKAKATYVHDLLNNYTEDDTKMKMGDLLNSETLQDKVGVTESIEAENPDNLPDLITILMQGNAMVVKSIEILLSMATDTADNTWLDRFAESDYDTLLDKVEEERPDLNTENKRIQYLDNLYGEVAGVLGADADALRDKLNDYAALPLHLDTATTDDIRQTFGDTKNDPEAMVRYNEWLMIGSIYESLKYYEGGSYQEGELLDFFLEEKDPEDEEIFLPMAAALSEGQRYGLPFVSFERLLTYALTNDEGWKTFAKQSKFDFGGMANISVYQNIDRDLYKDDGYVALTGAARRADNTADGTTGDHGEKMDTLAEITALSWAATSAFGVATLGSAAYALKKAMDASDVDSIMFEANDWNENVLHAIFHEDSFRQYMADEENFTWLNGEMHRTNMVKARYAVKLATIIGFITMAISVFSAVMTIIDLCRDKTFEQPPIPKYLVDNYTDADGGSYQLNYKAVECNREEYFGADHKVQKGSSADLIADEGMQWLALYASKNSKAGNGRPLTPHFSVQKSSNAPTGFDTNIHLFGEKGAVNIVGNAFKLYSAASVFWQSVAGDYSVYAFCKRSGDDVKTYDESAGNMTASSIGSGKLAVIGLGSLAAGIAIGAVAAVSVSRSKKKRTIQHQ
ncbi:MAG: hypothetical protein UIH27_04110 [Ruminococcus sp.]|nr:hypothetical protein [Ruminococcus sp.]